MDIVNAAMNAAAAAERPNLRMNGTEGLDANLAGKWNNLGWLRSVHSFFRFRCFFKSFTYSDSLYVYISLPWKMLTYQVR